MRPLFCSELVFGLANTCETTVLFGTGIRFEHVKFAIILVTCIITKFEVVILLDSCNFRILLIRVSEGVIVV